MRDSCITYRQEKLPNFGDFDLGQNICFWRDSPQWARASSFTRFLDHTQRRNTVGRTPLDERSARSRDLYLTTHTQNSQQSNAHVPGGIRTHNLNRRPAADLRLRPLGCWDRLGQNVLTPNLPAERNELIRNTHYLFLLSYAKIYNLKFRAK